MRHLARLLFIVFTVYRYGLDELALSNFRQRWVQVLIRVITASRRLDMPLRPGWPPAAVDRPCPAGPRR